VSFGFFFLAVAACGLEVAQQGADGQQQNHHEDEAVEAQAGDGEGALAVRVADAEDTGDEAEDKDANQRNKDQAADDSCVGGLFDLHERKTQGEECDEAADEGDYAGGRLAPIGRGVGKGMGGGRWIVHLRK